MRKADPRAEVEESPTGKVGDLIHGKYRVERVIGQGGMGVVVAARHLSLDKPVAIKLLSSQTPSEEALGRFTREARAAAKIKSEHVGSVLDVDVLPNGSPFIVMELLEGHDLADELLAETKASSERAVTIVLQACEAVAEAHASGIVHRDLKPANLFLAKTPNKSVMVKVLDFGISKITRREEVADASEKALTNPSTMLGSPLYMSPEQMKGSGDVDSRTDIWSLGVILYELLSGRSPFDANTIPMICANVLSQSAAPLAGDGVEPELEAVIRRCLEREPGKRYRDIAHLARALVPFAPTQGKITLERINQLVDRDGAPAASPASMAPPPMAPKPIREGAATSTAWEPKPASSPRKKILPVAFAIGLAVVILGFVAIRALTATPAVTAKPAAAAPAPIEPAPDPAEDPTAEPTADATGSAETPPVSSAAMTPTATASVSASSAPSAAPSLGVPPVVRHGGPKPVGRTKGFGGRE